jgi:hypothetical protein
MESELNKLSESEFNKFSQNGEDGVIKEILKRLKQDIILDMRCVEFGASDGITGSNTLRLVREESYESILIEPDKIKFLKLKLNLKNDKVIPLNENVDFEGDNTFDKLVRQFHLPYDIITFLTQLKNTNQKLLSLNIITQFQMKLYLHRQKI